VARGDTHPRHPEELHFNDEGSLPFASFCVSNPDVNKKMIRRGDTSVQMQKDALLG